MKDRLRKAREAVIRADQQIVRNRETATGADANQHYWNRARREHWLEWHLAVRQFNEAQCQSR
jgi:hypothetical protein